MQAARRTLGNMISVSKPPAEAESFLRYVDASPSPFHAVAEATKRLEAAGFTRLSERDQWDAKRVKRKGKYFVTRCVRPRDVPVARPRPRAGIRPRSSPLPSVESTSPAMASPSSAPTPTRAACASGPLDCARQVVIIGPQQGTTDQQARSTGLPPSRCRDLWRRSLAHLVRSRLCVYRMVVDHRRTGSTAISASLVASSSTRARIPPRRPLSPSSSASISPSCVAGLAQVCGV